jgi:hypothetical protein
VEGGVGREQAAAQFVDVEKLVDEQLGKLAPASGQAQVVRLIAQISKMRLEKKKFPKNFEGVLRFNNTVRERVAFQRGDIERASEEAVRGG